MVAMLQVGHQLLHVVRLTKVKRAALARVWYTDAFNVYNSILFTFLEVTLELLLHLLTLGQQRLR